MKQYDTIIIGAGIVGACVAHELTQQNQKVLLLDSKGIAKGGSGSAGAFVSPKIGKASPLHSLTNEAFSYARDFYLNYTPQYFVQTGVLRLAKDEIDSQKFDVYEKANQNEYEKYSARKLDSLGINSSLNNFYFPTSGICEAIEVCESLLKNIEVVVCEVTALSKKDGLWKVGEFEAKNIVLATGYKNDLIDIFQNFSESEALAPNKARLRPSIPSVTKTLIDIKYMGIHGVWGTRGDFKTSLKLEISMHQSLSISANKNGIIKLGATHQRAVKEPITKCQDEQSLILKKEASKLIDVSDFVLKESFCGMRSSSKDSFPLVGKVVDVEYMLKHYPLLKKGQKKPLKYIENLYVCNGVGGRGFVFAPLLAKILVELMVENEAVDKRVNPDRLFFKWCRKLI